MKGSDIIGHIVIEFNDQDTSMVNKIVRAVGCYPAFERLWLNNKDMLSFLEFEIYPCGRKVYYSGKEIYLRAK